MKPIITHDNHVHTRYCGHSHHQSPLPAYAEVAAERGLTISLREHAPLPEEYILAGPPRGFDRRAGVDPRTLTVDPADLDALMREVADTGISLGFEIDILPGFLSDSARLMADLQRRAAGYRLTVDAFNGSHHFFGGRAWDGGLDCLRQLLAEHGPTNFVREYFGAIREAARSGLFQAISHIDGPLRFDATAGESFGRDGFARYEDEFMLTLDTLADQGVALEYNTAGRRNALARPLLLPHHLVAAVERGVALVIGSDAHRPDQLGEGFAEAADELAAACADRLVRFVAGQPVPIADRS